MKNERLQKVVDERAEKMWECEHEFNVQTNDDETLIIIDWVSYDTKLIIGWVNTEVPMWEVYVNDYRLEHVEYEELEVDVFEASPDEMAAAVINWASNRF